MVWLLEINISFFSSMIEINKNIKSSNGKLEKTKQAFHFFISYLNVL